MIFEKKKGKKEKKGNSGLEVELSNFFFNFMGFYLRIIQVYLYVWNS